MTYFGEEALRKLSDERAKVEKEGDELLLKFMGAHLKDKHAQEFAFQGFLRRIKTLVRCIQNVYAVCPPDRTDNPSKDELTDVTINIQGFLFNTFGCLDNLAWVWVKEKNITTNGKPLKPSQIGLIKRDKHSEVRTSFSDQFRAHLDGLDEWFNYLENFRHALAHRIPLYIPPFIIFTDDEQKFQDMELEKSEALKRYDFERVKELTQAQDNLGHFRPWIKHSFAEKSGTIIFHSQMICDWKTIVGTAELFLKEIQNAK